MDEIGDIKLAPGSYFVTMNKEGRPEEVEIEFDTVREQTGRRGRTEYIFLLDGKETARYEKGFILGWRIPPSLE